MTETDSLPEHVETSIDAIAKLHAEHRRRTRQFQLRFEIITDFLSRPVCLVFVAFLIATWIIFNVAMRWSGHITADPPLFNWPQAVLALVDLSITFLILATQRRVDQLARGMLDELNFGPGSSVSISNRICVHDRRRGTTTTPT
jgi:uncharacterized membrane protein